MSGTMLESPGPRQLWRRPVHLPTRMMQLMMWRPLSLLMLMERPNAPGVCPGADEGRRGQDNPMQITKKRNNLE